MLVIMRKNNEAGKVAPPGANHIKAASSAYFLRFFAGFPQFVPFVLHGIELVT